LVEGDRRLPIRTGMDRERTATVHAALIAALEALG
jgi:hypothetical protein